MKYQTNSTKKLNKNNTTSPTTTWFPNVHGRAVATGGGRDDFNAFACACACAGGDDGGWSALGGGGGLGECTVGRRSWGCAKKRARCEKGRGSELGAKGDYSPTSA